MSKNKIFFIFLILILFLFFIIPLMVSSQNYTFVWFKIPGITMFYMMYFTSPNYHGDVGNYSINLTLYLRDIDSSNQSLSNDGNVTGNITNPYNNITNLVFVNTGSDGEYYVYHNFSYVGTYLLLVKADGSTSYGWTISQMYLHIGEYGIVLSGYPSKGSYGQGESGLINLDASDSNGLPQTNASVLVKITYPSGGVWIDWSNATEIGSGNYSYAFTTTSIIGTYTVYINFSLGSNKESTSTSFSVIAPSVPGGRPPSKDCWLVVSPDKLVFSSSNVNGVLLFSNLGGKPCFVNISKTLIPTLFGKKDLIKVSNDSLWIPPSESKNLMVNVTDVRLVRETSTGYLIINASDNNDFLVPVNILEAPLFYDVKVSTNSFFYYLGGVVNISVLVENKGLAPEKDTSLKVYVTDSSGEIVFESEEKLLGVPIGITKINKVYPISIDANSGRYRVVAEYDTEEQGLLRASNTFYVLIDKTNLLRILVIVGVILLSLVMIGLFIKRSKKRKVVKKRRK